LAQFDARKVPETKKKYAKEGLSMLQRKKPMKVDFVAKLHKSM
jgi:hypothetical protein